MSAIQQGWLRLQSSSKSSSLRLPAFTYGTAWKRERTAELVEAALSAGFIGLDTAAQPRHYREDLVGDGMREALKKGRVRREDLFLQTKFTPLTGQDASTAPYQPSDGIPEQIRASIASSFRNLRLEGADEPKEPSRQNPSTADSYIDCVLLHSPLNTLMETLIAWHTLEEFVPHRIRTLGISNIGQPNLELLYDLLDVKPAIVQNRFCAQQDSYDTNMRRFCAEHGIVYQAFGALTMNPHLLKFPPVARLADIAGISKEVALYSLILDLENVVVLNGTTNAERMRIDLDELERCRAWVTARENNDAWFEISTQFKELVNDTQS